MRTKKWDTAATFTVTWVGQWKFQGIKWKKLIIADTSEAREESQKWKGRDFFCF